MTSPNLADEIEGAEGPNFDLEMRIFRTVNPQATSRSKPPNYTASVDAALTLVPEGAFWSITMRGVKRGGYHACCATVGSGPLDWREAATPALALCAASLRARGEG